MRNVVIAVAKGHYKKGSYDTGAVGVGGLREYDVVDRIGDELVGMATAEGVAARGLPRQNTVGVPFSSIVNRLRGVAEIFAGASGPVDVVLLSLHCNSFKAPGARGTETFVSTATSKSVPLAGLVNANIVDALKNAAKLYVAHVGPLPGLSPDAKLWVDRGVKFKNFMILSSAAATMAGIRRDDFRDRLYACLIEYGFVSNPADAALLARGDACKVLAAATIRGVKEWYHVTKEQS